MPPLYILFMEFYFQDSSSENDAGSTGGMLLGNNEAETEQTTAQDERQTQSNTENEEQEQANTENKGQEQSTAKCSTFKKNERDVHKIPEKHTSKRKARKRPKNDDNDVEAREMLKKAYNVLSERPCELDAYFTYGQHLANELRKYDATTLLYVKQAINNVIFDADLGKYTPCIYQNRPSSSEQSQTSSYPNSTSQSSTAQPSTSGNEDTTNSIQLTFQGVIDALSLDN